MQRGPGQQRAGRDTGHTRTAQEQGQSWVSAQAGGQAGQWRLVPALTWPQEQGSDCPTLLGAGEATPHTLGCGPQQEGN